MNTSILQTVVGILTHKGRVLIFQRPQTSHAYGLWCFPGGKNESYETVQQTLTRELHEELGIFVTDARALLFLEGFQNHKPIQLHVYHILDYKQEFNNPENHIWTWAPISLLEDYPTFKINMRVVEFLKNARLPDSLLCSSIHAEDPNITWTSE